MDPLANQSAEIEHNTRVHIRIYNENFAAGITKYFCHGGERIKRLPCRDKCAFGGWRELQLKCCQNLV